MLKRSITLTAALLCWFASVRGAMAEDHAHAELIADVASIQPGVPFMLGVKFKIDRDWHIYWTNPGDAGIATEVKLDLPTGFTAEETMYPVPHRVESAGPIVNYVYEDEVMLMIRVTPPKDLPSDKPVKFSGKATWLVCKEDCIPGKGDVSIELPVATEAKPANSDKFDHWKKLLPMKQDPTDISSTSNALAITNGNGSASITIGWKKLPTDIQFFPGPMADGFAQDVKVETTASSTTISFEVKGYKGNAPVTGLVAFTSADGTKTAIEVSLPAGGK